MRSLRFTLLLLGIFPFLSSAQNSTDDVSWADSIISNHSNLHPDSATTILDKAAAIFEAEDLREDYYYAKNEAIPYRYDKLLEQEAAHLELLDAVKKDLGVIRVGTYIYEDLYNLYRRSGRVGDGIDIAESALRYIETLTPALERKRKQVGFHLRSSFLYNDLSDWEQSLGHTHAAIRIGESCAQQQPILLANALAYDGLTELTKRQRGQQKDFSTWIKQLERARQLALAQENRPAHINHIVRVHQILSHTYLMQGQAQAALQVNKAGVEIIENIANRDDYYYAKALIGLGSAYKDAPLPASWSEARKATYVDTALAYTLQAINLIAGLHKEYRRDLALAYLNIGYIAFESAGRNEQALGYFHRALNAIRLDTVVQDSTGVFLWESSSVCADLPFAIAAQRGKLDALLRLHEQNPKQRDWEDLIWPQLQQAEAILGYYRQNVPEHALQEAAHNWQFLLGEKGLQWVENQYSDGGNIQNTEALALAHTAVEQSINARLLGSLRSAKQGQLGKVPSSILEEEQRLRRLIAETRKELLDASRSEDPSGQLQAEGELLQLNYTYDRFLRQVAQEAPEYHRLKYDAAHPSLPELQKALDEETALLQYYISNNNIWLFYTDREESVLKIFDLDPPAPQLPGKSYADFFTQSCSQLRQALTDTDRLFASPDSVYSDLAYYGHELYKILLLDWVAQKDEIQNLVIIPYEKLHYIPFESLITKPVTKESPDFKALPYLLKRYAISYAYSAALWYENMQQKPEGGSGILGFAAAYDTASISINRDVELLRLRQMLSDLPGARAEVKQLQSSYPGSYFLEGAASEKAFKSAASGQYDVLHLATHGLLDEQNPFASSLAFTETEDSLEDNFVFAYELTQMDIQIPLVVLSACETGYGKFQHGEGVASLARSFMYAGAPSLVVSLWAVNDQSTAQLMKRFYQRLDEGLSKPRALQQAKLDYLERAKGLAAHPAFWASFVQLGNSEAIHIGPKSQAWIWQGLLGLLFICIPIYILWRWNKKKTL